MVESRARTGLTVAAATRGPKATPQPLRRCSLFAALALSLLAPAAARAQGGDDALAKQYYKLGEELYNRADYEGALKQFTQAFNLSKRPALLYNMGRCQESLGNYEKAIELYSEYLKSGPENPAVLEARIANLRKLIEKKKAAQPSPAPAPAPAPTPAPEPAPVDGPRPLRWPGWISVAAGGALLVTGIALGAVAKSKQREVEDANSKGREYAEVKSIEDSGRALGKASIATVVVGSAAAATGAVLLILDARRSRGGERRAWLAPAVVPGGASLAGGMSF
jgi:tetratricopeptide (TPR) repeat protein